MKRHELKGIGPAYGYFPADSPLHRLGAGWKMVLTCCLGAMAIAARSPWLLGGLLALNLAYYFLGRLRPAHLWTDLRFFAVQMAIIQGLYLLRYGFPDGLWPGLRTGLQILLFFLPGAVFLRTTTSSRIMESLRRIMPARFAFLVFTSLRFVPFFAREAREIVMVQRLRGARLSPRQLLNPRNWPDGLHCLVIPLMVRALKTAGEAALSAESRGLRTQGPEKQQLNETPNKIKLDPAIKEWKG